MSRDLYQITQHFLKHLGQEAEHVEPISSGLINPTFLVLTKQGKSFVLQQMNALVFKHPEKVQENIMLVSRHLQQKKYPKAVLQLLETREHSTLFAGASGAQWRMMAFIEHSVCYSKVQSTRQALNAAQALGEFHFYLSDLNAAEIQEAIPGFLDFRSRLHQFEEALQQGWTERKEETSPQIQWMLQNRNIVETYFQIEPDLPARIIHADPKNSNFLYRENSNEILALIDWDTISMGSVLYDFGDMVRSYTNTGSEDADQSRFDAECYQALLEGYLSSEMGKKLTQLERENLALGAQTVIYIQALRFLTDYLNGDVYYQVTDAGQNLRRAKNQIRLLEGMLSLIHQT